LFINEVVINFGRRQFSALEPWRNRLAEKEGRHWREDLPFSFDLPAGWDEAPALARALALLDDWARRDRTITPWLAFPMVLRRMGLTQRTLPCLVMGDPGQRLCRVTALPCSSGC
jgi:hypothetical protein